MEKFIENLKNAEKIISSIDHIAYVTFPLVQDKRLLLKILTDTKTAIANCINSILQYDYLYKRINLYKNPKENFRMFIARSAPRYKITEKEINLIKELFDIVEKYRESSFDFVKNNKIIILSENLKPETVSFEKTKEFLILGKNILRKTQEGILG